MTRFISLSAVAGACAALAGCNSVGTTTASTAPGYATQSYTPRTFKLPEGRGCSGTIARWQAVQQNDYASGNVNLSVYKQIQDETAKAAEACSAGRDAEATALVAASRRRHGYPA